MKSAAALPFLLACALAARGADDFAKYQVIIDKLPFGKPPEKPVAPPPPPPAQMETYAWVNDYRMTFMTQTVDNKAKVGLQNIKDQTTLSVETGDTDKATGIQLVAVSYDDRSATLSKGGQTHSLKLQDAATAPAAAAGGRVPPGMPVRPGASATSATPVGMARPPRPTLPPPPPAVPTTADPKPRLSGEELEKHLQEYQVEVIRRGLPPLPVKLTPENDAKLVAEGKLPSLDPNAAPEAPADPGQ